MSSARAHTGHVSSAHTHMIPQRQVVKQYGIHRKHRRFKLTYNNFNREVKPSKISKSCQNFKRTSTLYVGLDADRRFPSDQKAGPRRGATCSAKVAFDAKRGSAELFYSPRSLRCVPLCSPLRAYIAILCCGCSIPDRKNAYFSPRFVQ